MKNEKVLISVFLLAAFTFAACASSDGNASPQNDQPGTAPVAGSALAQEPGANNTSGMQSTAGQDGVDSVYTDLDAEKCRTVEVNEDEEWSVQKCEGAFGYTLEVTEGDLRQTIVVIDANGKRHDLELWSVVSSGFSYVGKKAEWRFRTSGGRRQPFALIVRYDVSEDPSNPEKTTSYLTVSKITDEAICVTDIVKPVKDANVKARDLALDAQQRPCLKKE